jgi:hypothetical protein
MSFDPDSILEILDRCCDSFAFPMLDNGYVYLAATRLSLFRSSADWALAIEIFGFSPRAGLPDTHIRTFASRLHDRNTPGDYVTEEAYQNYLINSPHDEYRSFYPIEEGPWQDEANGELVAEGAREVLVRGRAVPLPGPAEYAARGIDLEAAPRVHVFELCRYLADIAREQVLLTARERRVSIQPEMEQLLQLEEWSHPDVVDPDERPSGSEAFQQIARVLATGGPRHYRPTRPPNTHWRNWPEGGRL